MGKGAILADSRGQSDPLVGERGPLLPDREAIQPAKMVDVILSDAQLYRVGRDILEANLATEYRAGLFIGALPQKAACRGAVTCIHWSLLPARNTPY